MTGRSNLVYQVERLSEACVLVVGDVMLDRFVYGEISRISPEAPVPVLKYGETKTSLGGAGNVVRNLHALGARVLFLTVLGDDPEGEELAGLLSGLKGIESRIIVETGRATTVKTRFIAGRQQVLRLDKEKSDPLSSDSRTEVFHLLPELISRCNVVLVSDYAKGALSLDIPSTIISISKEKGKPVLVDPKGKDFGRYRGASLLTPNLKELSEATGLSMNGDESVARTAKHLIDELELESMVITRSQEGMSLVRAKSEPIHFRAEAKEVFDVSGAGDTVIAVLAASLGAGASLPEAVELSNIAAGIVVGKVGTAVVYPSDLIHVLHHQELSNAESKVVDIKVAFDRIDLWRRKGLRIGFTNGFFELIQPGHISLLTQASKRCDRLIVGLNGDASVKRLKGKEPVLPESARSTILASLEAVDLVIVFQEDTPLHLLDALRPDVLIKGSNYKSHEVTGADLVMSYGGEVVIANIPDIHQNNSTLAQVTGGTL